MHLEGEGFSKPEMATDSKLEDLPGRYESVNRSCSRVPDQFPCLFEALRTGVGRR